jgi:Mg2+ and Co2+ transporter CorA
MPRDPGWCKLDWVISDKSRGKLANASNVLDPTWEAPDGTIVPLDGFLDPYFQEVYLDTESIPIFSKLVKELSADTVDDYVEALEHEVWKYTVEHPSYGKVARRLYNVFRMNGHYAEAAFIRELFDEPITALYQVAAMIRTIGDAANSGDDFDSETMTTQVDKLIMSAIQALDGPEEAEMVGHLMKLRNSILKRSDEADRAEDMSDVQDAAMKAVNDYFERALRSVPEIDAYLKEIAARAP